MTKKSDAGLAKVWMLSVGEVKRENRGLNAKAAEFFSQIIVQNKG